MIPLQLASHNAICRNDWRGWELFKTGNGHNLGWFWTVDDRGILSYRTSVHFGRYWPCNGQNGHSKWKCYIYVFLYFVLYFSLIGTKTPTNICIHYHLPVVFFYFYFFYKIHTNMYVFGFHKADTHTKIENQSTSHYVKTFWS